jgi:hypothetical protein
MVISKCTSASVAAFSAATATFVVVVTVTWS